MAPRISSYTSAEIRLTPPRRAKRLYQVIISKDEKSHHVTQLCIVTELLALLKFHVSILRESIFERIGKEKPQHTNSTDGISENFSMAIA